MFMDVKVTIKTQISVLRSAYLTLFIFKGWCALLPGTHFLLSPCLPISTLHNLLYKHQ